MEEYQEKMKEYNKKVGDRELKPTDYICPFLRKLCVGIECAFYLSDADDKYYLGDHPCSINVIATNNLHELEKRMKD